MSIKASDVIEILSNTIPGAIVSTPLGNGYEISAREAFVFSAITGASYFENHIYPFTPKGLLKIFYNAMDFNFVTGIFDNLQLKNTPTYITQLRPYLTQNNKTIIPVEIQSEREFREILKKAFGQNSNADFLLLKIDLSKKGFGMEPFMEFLACKYFCLNGFITENQIPLSHTLGSPDFGGFVIEEIQKEIEGLNLLPKGFNVLELSMLRSFPLSSFKPINISNDTFMVGEAKTSTTIMEAQIRKYLSSGYYNSAFEIHPNKPKSSSPDLGLLSIIKNKISYTEPIKTVNHSSKNQAEYRKWLEAYFNCYVISNYENDELNALSTFLTGSVIKDRIDLVNLVCQHSFKTHINLLRKFLSNGAFK